jgi:RNA-directed DNA polymerase
MLEKSTVPLAVFWDSICWGKIENKVYQIQTRIVKYLKQGKLWLVKKLQRLLRHSYYVILLAIKRVTSNKGGKTAGVDGIVINSSELKSRTAKIIKEQKRYKALPLKRIFIPKKNGKMRPLGIPTIMDRIMQAIHLSAIEPVAEYYADKNSYGFRPKRSTADAITNCYQMLCRKNCAQWILEGDIKGCFDNISHNWLLNNIPTDKKKLKQWLKAGYIFEKKLFDVEAGTPQGGIVSPVLANMVLDGLEAQLNEKFKRRKVNYTRYADDFIITGETKELLEKEVKPVVVQFLKERGLQLSAEKTVITHINEGFDFLGFNIKSYNGKVLTKPSKKSIKSILEKVKTIIKNNRQTKQENLIRLLNPVIRGWGNYYSHVVSKKIFSQIDHHIVKMLIRWAKRRHPKKSRNWISNRYFESCDDRNWVFRADKTELLEMAKIPIKRHIKIRKDANPYDTEYGNYFRKRSYYHLYKDNTNIHLEQKNNAGVGIERCLIQA